MAGDDHPFDAPEEHFKLEDSSISQVATLLLAPCALVSMDMAVRQAFALLKEPRLVSTRPTRLAAITLQSVENLRSLIAELRCLG